MLKKITLPIQLLGVIALVFFFGNHIGEWGVRLCYTFSLVFKELLSLLLPAVIFAFVTTGILSFRRNAPYVLGIIAGTVFVSNAFVAFLAYCVARLVLPFMCSLGDTHTIVAQREVLPLWTPSFSCPLSSESALVGALIVGMVLSFVPSMWVEQRLQSFKELVSWVLSHCLIPLLPIYVLGFLLKINHEQVFGALIGHYGGAFVCIITLQLLYLLWFYVAASGFVWERGWQALKNALPSYLTAFSTMSSTVTVPVSVDCAEKNTGNRPLANTAMPIMANIHLLGDSISTPILAMVTMTLFLGSLPGIVQYMGFIFYFCTTMFAVSAVPGGGIIVMIPVLINQLGFTPEMISIITMLYLLFDPFGTAANVMGDGALVIVVNKILRYFKIVEEKAL